jgi:hypothetical protein
VPVQPLDIWAGQQPLQVSWTGGVRW